MDKDDDRLDTQQRPDHSNLNSDYPNQRKDWSDLKRASADVSFYNYRGSGDLRNSDPEFLCESDEADLYLEHSSSEDSDDKKDSQN